MGNLVSSLPVVNRCFALPSFNVLFIGLDAAGKTTLLYRLKLGEVVTTIPTIGFNVETVTMSHENRRLEVIAFDVGSRDKSRPLIRHYLQNQSAFVCVVDSTDAERLEELDNTMLNMLCESEISDLPLLFLLNKQDLDTKITVDEETIRRLPNVKACAKSARPIGVFGISAKTGDGVAEAMEWLMGAVLRGQRPQEGDDKTPGIVSKPSVGLRWWLDAGKRILCLGA